MKAMTNILWMLPSFLLTAILLPAQNCAFFPFEKGTVIEYANYDSKDKLLSTAVHKVVMVDDNGSAGITAQIETILKDQKGKETMKNSYTVTCKGNSIFMDMRAQLLQGAEAFANMETTVSGVQLEIPATLTPGQTLPDANMEIQASSGGINLMKMRIDVTNRKVDRKETITTPAGTFEGYKILQTTSTKMLVGKSFETATWYAQNAGMVRSENYDKKGKLESYTLLTKFGRE